MNANQGTNECQHGTCSGLVCTLDQPAPPTIGRHNAPGGTGRTQAQRNELTRQATALTGIPLLDGPSLRPDIAGHLSTLPEKISHATATQILTDHELTADPATLSALLRTVNPATGHAGGRPRKVTTTNDEVRILTTPTPRTAHGSAIHAAFQAQDADLRSFHDTARQAPLTPYQEARIAVATRRAQRALAKLSAAQGADW